jgi:hypothetical protein
MLHFVPLAAESSQSYAEAAARLASIRRALRLVDPYGGGPAPDLADDEGFTLAWATAGEAKQRCFDSRSGRTAGAVAAGIEALLAEREARRTPSEAASRKIAEEIRVGLEDVSRLMLG